MTEFLHSLPKAELHLHLEGAVWPETLCEIEPALTPQEVSARYRYSDFLGFLKCYAWVTSFLRGPAEYRIAARRLFAYLRTQGVRHLELNLSVGVMIWRQQNVNGILDAVFEESMAAGFPVYFIFDAVRQFSMEETWRVARLAVARRRQNVIGFGIGGDEGRGPAGLFREVFAYTTKHGLHALPHAGESQGPESVWAALELGARRIGHGIRSIDDPVLVRHLANHKIPLEICVSSNVATGVVPSLEEHPLRKLYDRGIPITLNTDDPAMFHCTLLGEYQLALDSFGFTQDEIAHIAQNSLRYSLVSSREEEILGDGPRESSQ